MSKKVLSDHFGEALGYILEEYRADLTENINQESKRAIQKLEKITKQTAPKRTGNFAKAITYKLLKRNTYGNVYVWYAKDPEWRKTHLIVNGHETVAGTYTRPNSFLSKAVKQVAKEYEQKVREIASGK